MMYIQADMFFNIEPQELWLDDYEICEKVKTEGLSFDEAAEIIYLETLLKIKTDKEEASKEQQTKQRVFSSIAKAIQERSSYPVIW